MLIRSSIVAAITLCFTLEALPAMAQSFGIDANVHIALPTFGFVVIGDRQYYKRSPGWGYRRNKHGWYKMPRHDSGYIMIGGRQYYERSPGDGYRRNRNGWYRAAPGRGAVKRWNGRGKYRPGKQHKYRGNGRGHGRGNGHGRGHGRGHGNR